MNNLIFVIIQYKEINNFLILKKNIKHYQYLIYIKIKTYFIFKFNF